MSDNVVFMRITNPAGKTTSRGFEIDRDGIVLNPANHQPMFFQGRDEPISVHEDAVEIVNNSDQFAVEQMLSGNCESISAGVDMFYAKRDEDKKSEKQAENEFLKSKGYRWQKRSIYNSGEGEMEDCWFLFDADDKAVVGYKDGGFDLIPFGNVKSILTELGYYGQEAINEAEAEKKVSVERRAMRDKIDAFFNDDSNRLDDAEPNFTTRPIQIESFMPRRQFYIEPDGIWLDAYNSADGDDWSLNNTDFGIAHKYQFNAEIASFLEALSK